MARERRGYVDTPDGLIHYREAGEGPETLLLLHQTPSNSEQYSASLPLLARELRVVAMDTPGFGMSDRPAERPPDMSWYARRVVDLLDGLGVERAHLFGHHTGATIALETAAQHPDRIGKVVFFGLLALADGERDYWLDNYMPRWQPDTGYEFLESWVKPKTTSVVPEGDSDQILRETAATLQAGPQYWWTYNAVFTHDSYDRIGKVRSDVLLLNPTGDLPALIERMRQSQPHFASQRWVDVEGHPGKHMREPEEYTTIVLDFLAGRL